MLKQVHDPWTVKSFSRGVNTDLDAEMLADGVGRDMYNMRPTSLDGNSGTAEKVQGEVLRSDNEGAPATYTCIGQCVAGGDRVAFWASSDPTLPPIIRINGTTMASSPVIPYEWDRQLQLAVVDINGGVVYPADHHAPPLFWDIAAIKAAFAGALATYFGGLTIESVSVGLNVPAHFPVLENLEVIGGTGGLLPGLYTYAMRWVTVLGDRTNISPETPTIAVPYNLQLNSLPQDVFPGGRNYGGPPSLIPTQYGIRIKFRIDNYSGYDSLEIIRTQFNDGAGLTGAGQKYVVGRIPLTPGQNTINTFLDPGDSTVLELIPADEAVIQQLLIDEPKGVEYMDSRLEYANFKVNSRQFTPTFTEVGGEKMVPITSKLTKTVGTTEIPDGYNNPQHFTYKKSFGRGEKYGISIAPWDGILGKAPAVPIPGLEDVQFPNRREEKTGDSLVYSDDACYAGNVDHVPSATFEAFTQGDQQRTDVNSVGNISRGSIVSVADFTLLDPNPPANATFVPAIIGITPSITDVSYAPLSPTGNNDVPDVGWDMVINNGVYAGEVDTTSGPSYTYRPKGFAPTYHALGGLLYGVTGLPTWVRAFTIGRTEAAGRVITQGLFMYNMFETPGNLKANKTTAGGWFFSPDMLNGIVPQATVDDIMANPTRYKLQFVSPLGFFTECFNHHVIGNPLFGQRRGQNMDMISFSHIQHDQGEINPFDTGTQGIPTTPGGIPFGNYVDWGRWRGTNTTGSTGTSWWHAGGNNGNTLVDLSGFSANNGGSLRSPYWSVATDQYVYMQDSTVNNTAPNHPDVRKFHEPWYVVNIIDTGATAPDLSITPYVNTGTTIMIESCIGVSDGSTTQLYPLVGERTDDVYPYLDTDFRYVYVDGEAWVCRTNNAFLNVPANFIIVLNAIALGGWTSPDGTLVKGVYTFSTLTNSVILQTYGVPAAGARITVRYNPDAPIKFFGGDRTIAPCVWAPQDRTGIAGSSFFNMYGTPMPSSGFVNNPRYMVMYDDNTTEETLITSIYQLRQWIVMFDCETLGPLPLADNLLSQTGAVADLNQFYPAVNYIMRPNVYVQPDAAANNLWPQYDTDYPSEITSGIMSYGGFRFWQHLNLDYAHGENVQFTSVPQVGFLERTDYPTGVAWSAKADPLQQDSPGLRTFTTDNLYVLSQETGEIKTIYALNAGGGQNLYGRTHSGTFKLLTNKNVLTGVAGETVGTQATDVFIGPNSEIWLSRSIGSPYEHWEMGTKAVMLIGSQYHDGAFWPDKRTVYRQVGDSIVDIATGKYLKKILPFIAETGLASRGRRTAFYNEKRNEYWMVCDDRMFVFCSGMNEWAGEYGYAFDGYLNNAGRIYGFRDREDWELEQGYVMNGEPMLSWAESVYTKPDGMQKEAVRFRHNATTKPTANELYDESHVLMTRADFATFGQYWIKYIDGYEQFISRNMASYDFNRKRPQQRVFFLREIHQAEEAHVLNSSSLQLHQIV